MTPNIPAGLMEKINQKKEIAILIRKIKSKNNSFSNLKTKSIYKFKKTGEITRTSKFLLKSI